jgi:hypothetical protein
MPPLRLVRASIFATVCVILTCLGHFAASGRPIAGWAIGAAFAGALGFAYVLAGHERSLATIVGGLLGGQFVLHTLFSTGHAHHAAAQPAVHHDDASNGLGMTLAHLLAGVVSAWWLRRGERGAWRLARMAAAALLRPPLLSSHVAEVLDEPAVIPGEAVMPRPRSPVLRHVVVLRGPPAGALAR